MAGEMIAPRWRPVYRRGFWIGALCGAAAAAYLVQTAGPLGGEAELGLWILLGIAGMPLSLVSLPFVGAPLAMWGILVLSVPVMWGVYSGGIVTIGAMLVQAVAERLRLRKAP
jgi:hypothetical protein